MGERFSANFRYCGVKYLYLGQSGESMLRLFAEIAIIALKFGLIIWEVFNLCDVCLYLSALGREFKFVCYFCYVRIIKGGNRLIVISVL